MTDPVALRRLGVLSPFDEARAEVMRWEKEYPDAVFVALVVLSPDNGFEYTLTGQRTITEAVGIFTRAAHLAAE